ncbi:hypothetical protein BC827DRAFT_1212019 [Russula dissimulans]|nr:hypothetical protein BC827DRAFT_1212019 [Russula dissimulans]
MIPQYTTTTHHPTEMDVPSPGQRVVAIDAILDVVFSFSAPRTIISLSKSCRAARPIAASYFRVAYKPEHLLRQFLPDPATIRAFRILQAETGLTIVGKAARNFLSRALQTGRVMSLYVDRSHAPLVSDFLMHAGYGVEIREHLYLFFKTGGVAREIILHASQPDSFDIVDKPRNLPSSFTDVITFDGAYSLFPARYDEEVGEQSATPAKPSLTPSKPIHRSFSDRASWVVTFEPIQISLTEVAFGTSLLARHPTPPKGSHIEWYNNILLCGVVLRSPLLRLTHVMCCDELSHVVQQFLTRLVIAHPGRSNSYFDAEVAQFLLAGFKMLDIRDGHPPYLAVWDIMKEMAPLPSDTPGAGGLQWPHKT